jgi:hypothetical protein
MGLRHGSAGDEPRWTPHVADIGRGTERALGSRLAGSAARIIGFVALIEL